MNIALIVAAGSGSRMGNADKPKQFLPIYGKPLMIHTIEAFEVHDEIDAIVVVTNEAYIDQVKVWCKQYDLGKIKAVVAGGDSRQISVHNGLQAVKAISKDPSNDIVLIHDAASPLISQRIITDNIRVCEKYDAVDTVIKASDTIVRSINEESISDIPARNELYQGQTPQSFKLSLILDAHEYVKTHEVNNVTDDCKLVLSLGKEVRLVEGSKQNFNITTFDDPPEYAELV
jgi:2-C-methyl-D-erythritol 4-phosphate cytidylyltransferase